MNLIMNCISDIYKDIDLFFITHRDVQRWLGPNDCGLFVLAFLYALVDPSFDGNGKDPSFLRFEQRKMRSHYAYCTENYIFIEFPSDEMFRHKKWVLFMLMTVNLKK